MNENENKAIDPKLQETLKGIWDSLTDEQKEKAKACKTWEELSKLTGQEGIELPDELLDDVSGGNLFLIPWLLFCDDEEEKPRYKK